MRIPSDVEIRALHMKYAPTRAAFDLVFTHCEIVREIADQLLARASGLDADLVRAGCLLHDIGVYRLYGPDGRFDGADYIRHGVLGHEILAAEGFTEELCRFCSCHTGMGITRADVERQGLPLPLADYVAQTDEEELVMYADKFHSKTTPPTFVSGPTFLTHVRRFGEDKVTEFARLTEKFGTPDLTPVVTAHGHTLT
ncbi:HD domain-containing protein [Actinomadura atramentaria]|uniref:HD domain-containing protein n=1 Tax=Actinomadura atramentaria TaxID=1990 RepID=UPI00037F440E|nr:HD domain-containing protein [Actinomadura atramentaria]